MSYKTMTFKKAIKAIHSREMLLPAIQRKFVWDAEQIQNLFDSIMRDYPIGSFLFWEVKPDAFQNYAFYEFMKDYHQRDNEFNTLTPKTFKPTVPITGVLDGQQRLSSLYIGLTGTYACKLPYYGWNNDKAFPKKVLCINLLYKKTEEDSVAYWFEFIDEKDADLYSATQCWFKVSNILKWSGAEDNDEWFDKEIDELKQCEVDGEFPNDVIEALMASKKDIKKALSKLFHKLHTEEILNYFEVQSDDIDAVLEIFARVNSGGKTLSKSDLLFSTIVAHWNDGRDNMEELLLQINQKGFAFDSDFIVRACQMLALDIPMKLEVKNFTATRVLNVQEKWENIEKALIKMADWLKEFGYSRDTLTSQNAVLPIAYYLYNGGNENCKNDWRKYIAHALIKNIFSSHNDRLLEELRTELKNKKTFSFDEWLGKKFVGDKTFLITEEEVDDMLEYKKGRSAYIVLSYLYSYKYNEMSIDLDHIHPASGFTETRLKKLGLDNSTVKAWQDKKDQLPNLQMLDSSLNRSKNDTAIKEWIGKKYSSSEEGNRFFLMHYYPQNVVLDFDKFDIFFDERKKMLKKKLIEIFIKKM
jgi:Protein of unknown function DUF262